MSGESQSRALAELLAGFTQRRVTSVADLEAWVRDARALGKRLDNDLARASQSLTEDEWWCIQHYLDDADIRMKEPSSAYSRTQEDRMRQVIAKLESL